MLFLAFCIWWPLLRPVNKKRWAISLVTRDSLGGRSSRARRFVYELSQKHDWTAPCRKGAFI